MAEPATSDGLTQGVKDAQAKFAEGMRAVGDASPYPMLAELRATAPVHRGWPEMGIPASQDDEPQIFSVYRFDAVKAVFTDNTTFSTRCYEAIVRPLQGPTILEMQEPEHALYRVTMSDEQIYGFMRNLLPAGAETTSRSTANLALGLLTHPDQLAAVQADRSLLPQAIEEGIRWETPLLNFMRETTRDVEFHGVDIPEGSSVAMNLGNANHDEDRWDDPESFNIFRDRKPHIGFGHGAHVCLGMHLARLESTLIFNTLFDRLPGLRLDPDAPPPYVAGTFFRSPQHLNVIWD
jgi:cytochrome P450